MAGNGYRDVTSKVRGASTGRSSGTGVVWWGNAPEAWDTVVLGGLRLPGLCALKGKGYAMRAQHRNVPGMHGESTTTIGREPAEFDIHLMLMTEQHLKDFAQLVRKVKHPPAAAKPTTPEVAAAAVKGAPSWVSAVWAQKAKDDAAKPKAPAPPSPGVISVSHPLLTLFEITRVRVMDITLPTQVQDKGMWEVTIKCREHVSDGKRGAGVAGNKDDLKIVNLGPGEEGRQVAAVKLVPPSVTNAGPR